MPRTVVAYVTAWCPDCTRSRRVLKQAGVAFEEIDIERVPGAEDAMRRLNGGRGKVPTIQIDGRVLVEPNDDELRAAIRFRIGGDAA
ncbi:MAG: glutaredoxin family protein [Chthonomonadales bacterium]|nr:glutaredoxin family protein [Chthonomonadales bacterium]